jgi:hypothetical protein
MIIGEVSSSPFPNHFLERDYIKIGLASNHIKIEELGEFINFLQYCSQLTENLFNK